MIWRDDTYRTLLVVGSVDVGAVYPPVRSSRRWRWRIWVNSTGHPIVGNAQSHEHARREVESRFRAFLSAAQLAKIGGDA
jgi:hypothetical protein